MLSVEDVIERMITLRDQLISDGIDPKEVPVLIPILSPGRILDKYDIPTQEHIVLMDCDIETEGMRTQIWMDFSDVFDTIESDESDEYDNDGFEGSGDINVDLEDGEPEL